MRVASALLASSIAAISVAGCSGDDGGTGAGSSSGEGSAGTTGSGGTTSASMGTSGASGTGGSSSGETDATSQGSAGSTSAGSTSAGTDGTSTTGVSQGSDSDATTDAGTGSTGSTSEAQACSPGAVEACYSGPEGTEGVGLCAAGERVCDAMGMGFGPCEGEVLPAPESCESPGDEDCDGLDPCTGKGDHVWSKIFSSGNGDGEEGLAVATDAAGNVFILASGYAKIDFGGGPVGGAGLRDGFVAKFDADGEHLWSRSIGDSQSQFSFGGGLAVTPAGGVVIASDFDGVIDLGGGPLSAQNAGDVFLATLDADGKHVWSKRFGCSQWAAGTGVSVDPSGSIGLTGWFRGQIDFGGGPLVAPVNPFNEDAYVARFDKDGKPLWSLRFGDGSAQEGDAIAADAAGNLYVCGRFQGTINPGKGQMTSAGGVDVFVVRFDGVGNAAWQKRYGDAQDQHCLDLRLDEGGRPIVGGFFRGAIDFGGGALTASSETPFLAALDASGGHLWSKAPSGTSSRRLLGIAVDPFGNLAVTGQFGGTIDLGGGVLTSEGSTDVFIARLTGTAGHLWSRQAGDFQAQRGDAVAADPSAYVITLGTMAGAANFGGGPLTSKGGEAIFLSKHSP